MLGTHGILDPHRARAHFELARHAPAPDLAWFVERYWTIAWSLAAPYAQETLPFPVANLVFGTHRPGLFGVQTQRFVAHLEGEGWVVAVKFRPGGLRALVDTPMSELTDAELAVGDAFGPEGAALDRAIHAASGDAARLALVDDFLRRRAPSVDADVVEAGRIVDLAGSDPSIVRVAELASRSGASVRTLERLFRTHVGVPPKWVIRRFRMHEAAARAADSASVDWSTLAQDLGYFDQAHFIRDFKQQIGRTPTEYAAACAKTFPRE